MFFSKPRSSTNVILPPDPSIKIPKRRMYFWQKGGCQKVQVAEKWFQTSNLIYLTKDEFNREKCKNKICRALLILPDSVIISAIHYQIISQRKRKWEGRSFCGDIGIQCFVVISGVPTQILQNMLYPFNLSNIGTVNFM